MKKLSFIFLMVFLALTFIACSDEQTRTNNNDIDGNTVVENKTEDIAIENKEDEKILVVYFSMPETTDQTNMTQDEDNSVVVIDGKVLGNTEYVANLIQENTGADIYRIERAEPYPADHDTLVDVASEEQANNARPELLTEVENIEQYDTIFLGYPTWWADMPMPMYTFLEKYDLSDKTIIPFNTHGGSSFASTINKIQELQPNATVIQEGFTASRNVVEDSESDVVSWLEALGY